jgi:Predicted glycosyltransferases
VSDDITLVIPTHNRHALLAKSLPYYAGLGYPIVVVDSSAAPFGEIGRYPDVKYVHCPGEPFPHKLRAPVAQLVRTPYIFFSADDMFMAPEAVQHSLDFLKQHPDYSSAQGHYFGIPMNGDWDGLRAMYVNMDNYDNHIDADKPYDRMLQLFCRYYPTFYAVFKTDCWKNQLERFPDAIRNYCLAEFYFAICSAIHGKHIILPELYALTYLAPTVDGIDPFFRNDLHELATMERYAEEYKAFETAILNYLLECEQLPERRGRLYIAKTVALQAWKAKPTLTAKEKIRREYAKAYDKAFNGCELKKRKAERRKREQQALRDETEFMLERVGNSGQALLREIWSKITAPQATREG